MPAPGAEFTYILAKAAAKGKEFGSVAMRLAELLRHNSSECLQTAGTVFGHGLPDGEAGLEAWEEWYARARCFTALRAGRRVGAAEASLYLKRVRQPTGLWLTVLENDAAGTSGAIVDRLRPAFRRMHSCGPLGLPDLPGLVNRLVRSSLVVEHVDLEPTSLKSLRNRFGVVLDLRENNDPVSATRRVLERLATRLDKRFART